jgi:hypothetical protein
MQQLSGLWLQGRRVLIALVLVLLMHLSVLGFADPSYAAGALNNSELTQSDKLDRAYEWGESTGLKEEIYQQRLQEGQDPEKMPRPYKRMRSFDKQQEVPETSLVEKAASQVRQLVDQPDRSK